MVKTSGKLSKPELLTNVLVFINKYIFFNILKLDLGVYINDVNNTIKQYFVRLVMIFFKGFFNDNLDYEDKLITFLLCE